MQLKKKYYPGAAHSGVCIFRVIDAAIAQGGK